jgi:hypothetical protein
VNEREEYENGLKYIERWKQSVYEEEAKEIETGQSFCVRD